MKVLNSLVCLIFILIGLFYFTAYFPGFLAYQDQKKREIALPFIETIYASLKIYSDKQPENLFPKEINNYGDLSRLVNEAGKYIPKNQNDTKIDYLHYETTDRKNFILSLTIESNDMHFFIVYPEGIITITNLASIEYSSAMELIRTLLKMDLALLKRKVPIYLSYYKSYTSINIISKSYKVRRTDKNREILSSNSYVDLESYSSSMINFYSRAFPNYRKRDEIFINKEGKYLNLHSSYIEEGIINEEKYLKEGRNIYKMELLKRSPYIGDDKSFYSIYMFKQ
jgi:hypothetical protein